MLFEIRYQRKSDPEKKVFKGSVIVDSMEFARSAFRAQVNDPSDYLILGVRDISTENITLDVKDVSQKQTGKI